MNSLECDLVNDGLENLEDIYLLSPMQQGMLFHTLYTPDSGVYFEQSLFTITGELDIDSFEAAWQQVVDRHQILRSSFVWEELESPQQIVHRRVKVPFEKYDWTGLSKEEQDQRLTAFLADDSTKGFDLAVAPLLRLSLFAMAPNRFKFVFGRHHLLMDRWSRSILLKEVFTLYDSLSRGATVELQTPRPYGDYISWISGQDADEAREYWTSALQGISAPTSIPVDSGRDAVGPTYSDERLYLSETITDQLRSFARENKVTLNVVAQAAWALLLHRYSGDADVVFGVTVSGRPPGLEQAESMIGLFINTLPLRVGINENQKVTDWLKQQQDEQSRMQQFEHSSLIDIQGWSEVPRGQHLFESIFVFENLPVTDNYAATKKAIEFDEDRGFGSTTGYPLTVLVNPRNRLSVQIFYDQMRFETDAIKRMLGHYEQLIVGLANSSSTVARVEMLTQAEREQILRQWNDTKVSSDNSQSLVQLFEEQVAKQPNAIAVVFDSRSLTYAELNATANRLAHYLIELGIRRDSRVGVCMERRIDLVVSVLATMKAGAAYVPLDPEYPEERVQFMLEDSACSVVLTSSSVAGNLAAIDARFVAVDAAALEDKESSNPNLEVFDDQLAYIIYTSGSTGRPKGVAMPHGALRNLINWQLKPPFVPARTVQFSSLSFDVSFQEIFSTCCSGGTLVIVSQDTRVDATVMLDFLRVEKVERIFLPFIYLQHLSEAVQTTGLVPDSLREVITAGEQLEITPAIRELFEKLVDCRLHNHYGPSETHVVTSHTLSHDVSRWPALPPIGRPIANTQIYIVDAQFQAVPALIPGELLIGGANVSRGYLERADLTAEKFVPDPFSAEPGARLYRTGDLGRYAENGDIEFLGRIDNQVKIRGFRIELGEIETALVSSSLVKNATVLVREGVKGNELIAYVVSDRASEITFEQDLRSQLKSVLPDYMIPARFVLLEKLPLTASGKIDRRALPAPESLSAVRETFKPPLTADELRMARIWESVLQQSPIGLTDSFFDLGGHSLIATQLISRVRQEFSVDLPLKSLFESPTIAGLLGQLQSQQTKKSAPVIARSIARDETDLLANLDQLSDKDVEALLNDLLAEQN